MPPRIEQRHFAHRNQRREHRRDHQERHRIADIMAQTARIPPAARALRVSGKVRSGVQIAKHSPPHVAGTAKSKVPSPFSLGRRVGDEGLIQAQPLPFIPSHSGRGPLRSNGRWAKAPPFHPRLHLRVQHIRHGALPEHDAVEIADVEPVAQRRLALPAARIFSSPIPSRRPPRPADIAGHFGFDIQRLSAEP